MGALRKPLETYEGRTCAAAPGTHAGLVALLRKHVPPTAGLLDVGTNTGALLLRLKKAGFTELYGSDFDPRPFDVPGATFVPFNLNRPFSEQFDRQFNVITATEVIEHIDDPRTFLREVHKLLADGGYFALTTPNVAFWEGRCKFMLKGELWGFGENNYRGQRHVSPATFETMDLMLRELGFQPVERGTYGSFATPLRWLLGAPLWVPIRALGGKSALGESMVYLARKAEPDPTLQVSERFQDQTDTE